MAVHPGAAGIQQDRPAVPGAGCPGRCLAGRGRRRDQDDRGALAAHARRPVAVPRVGVADVRAGGFEDPAATPRPGQNGAGPAE